MTTQHITEFSPASVAALSLIAQKPGITTSEIAIRGGWSVYHVRNVLRYLRGKSRVRSEQGRRGTECRWFVGVQVMQIRTTKRRAFTVSATNSVFALGAACAA